MALLGFIALLCTLVGLILDIVGAGIIFFGLKRDASTAYESAFEAAAKLFDEGSGLTRSDIEGRLAEANAKSNVRWSLLGLKLFIAGFLLQGVAAILSFVASK